MTMDCSLLFYQVPLSPPRPVPALCICTQEGSADGYAWIPIERIVDGIGLFPAGDYVGDSKTQLEDTKWEWLIEPYICVRNQPVQGKRLALKVADGPRYILVKII